MFCVTKVVCVVFLFRSCSHSLCFSESLTRPNFCSHCVSSFPTECLTSSNWNPPKTGYSHLLILSLSLPNHISCHFSLLIVKNKSAIFERRAHFCSLFVCQCILGCVCVSYVAPLGVALLCFVCVFPVCKRPALSSYRW